MVTTVMMGMGPVMGLVMRMGVETIVVTGMRVGVVMGTRMVTLMGMGTVMRMVMGMGMVTLMGMVMVMRMKLVPVPTGERQRQRAAERGGGHHQAEGLPLGDARAAPGLERPRPLRADRA